MPATLLKTDGTVPVLTVQDARWHYSEVTSPGEVFENSMWNLVASGRYRVGYEGTTAWTSTVITNTPDIIVQAKQNAINSITTIFHDSSTDSNTTVNDKFIYMAKNLFPMQSPLNYFQMKVNERFVPEEPCVRLSRRCLSCLCYVPQHDRIKVY